MAENKVQVVGVSQFNGLRTDTPASKCPAGYSPDCADMVFSPGGMATRNPFRANVMLPADVEWRKEFTCKDGTVQVLALDVNGVLYSVAEDGSTIVLDMVAAGSRVNSVTAYGREYMSFFNDDGGCDAPRQWDGKNLYRVSQGAPGAGPTFTPVENDSDTFAINTITQPPARSRSSSYYLQSAGPGNSTTPGTTVTVYYSDLTVSTPDENLVNAVNSPSGDPVYIYFKFIPDPAVSTWPPQGPFTVLVTGVNSGNPPGQPRPFAYFTFELPTTSLFYFLGNHPHEANTAFYQRTVATLKSSVPIPGVAVNNNVTITGTSVANYNTTWPISQTPNSGQISISQSSLGVVGAGVANYSYLVTSGVPPAVGQMVTISGLTNGPIDPTTGNSVLNVTNGVIASVSGGTSGSFTISGLPAGVFPAAAESGFGITAGNVFLFEPALLTLGSSDSPIYGNSVGGFVIFDSNPADISIAAGNRQAVLFFIYPDEYTTGVSPIVKFTVPSNTKSLRADDLPIGPANCIGRGIALTQANGSRFFYLDIPAQVNGIISGTATVIMDNTSTSAVISFSDLSLAGGQAIDIPGNNLFQQIALNLPRGVDWYEDRLFWIGEKNTVIGFLNMDMAGGTNGVDAKPLGWTSLDVGAVEQLGFMPAYVVTSPNSGELSQGAAKMATGTAIIQSNLRYSLRFWTDGGAESGLFQATLQSASTAFSSVATYELSTITQAGYVTMNFSLAMPAKIPDDLTFSIKFLGLVGTAKIRDLQMIFADNPNRNPIARASYVVNPQAYDALTGNIGPNDDPTELRAIFVLQESLHFLTQKRLYDVQAIGNSEPSSWDPNQVSDKCGTFNSNSVTTGKGWAAWGGEFGGFWYTGGIPQKTTAIIAPTWRKIANISNVFDDSDAERVYFGIVGKDGTKSMQVYDYHEVDLSGPGKWCPWNRPASWICNSGQGTTFIFGQKFYLLDEAEGTDDDDFGPIAGNYTFSPFAVTMFQKSYQYMGLRITGAGVLTPFLYAAKFGTITQTLRGQELSTLIDTIAEWDQNIRGRLLFMKLGQAGVRFSLEDATVLWQNDPNSPVSGTR